MSTELLIYTTRRLKQFRVQQLTMENHILAIPETGTITFNDGSGDVTVNPYEAVFFEKGKHYTRSSITPFYIHYFRFMSDEPVFSDHFVKFKNVDRIKSTLELLNRVNRDITFQSDFSFKKNLFTDIVNLYRLENKPFSNETENKDSLIEIATTYLNENYFKKINLPDISDSVGLSYVQFLRRFKASTGITPFQYLANLRVTHAKQLLTKTELSIKEIAPQCGFDNEFYFCNFFKKQPRMSPSSYRNYI